MSTDRHLVALNLTEQQAIALALLAKRMHFEDFEGFGSNQDEADSICIAVVELQKALDAIGFNGAQNFS